MCVSALHSNICVWLAFVCGVVKRMQAMRPVCCPTYARLTAHICKTGDDVCVRLFADCRLDYASGIHQELGLPAMVFHGVLCTFALRRLRPGVVRHLADAQQAHPLFGLATDMHHHHAVRYGCSAVLFCQMCVAAAEIVAGVDRLVRDWEK